MMRRIPGQRYFDRKFLLGVGLWLRAHGGRPRNLIVAAAVGTLYLVAGGTPLLLAALGIVAVTALIVSHDTGPAGVERHPQFMSDAEFAELEQTGIDDEVHPPIVSELAYERALVALRALEGWDVSVVIAGADGEPAATLDGRLHAPVNISQADVEVLSYSVGPTTDSGSCFYLPRAEFLYGTARVERGDVDGALRLTLGNIIVWVFERTPAER